jgi:hypothetical protein
MKFQLKIIGVFILLAQPPQLCHTEQHTRVAQKVMPRIVFIGNYLFRMYEIHAEYNWMFPLHMSFFPQNLHLRLWPCASTKQGHACLPYTSLFPVHLAMSSLHESGFSPS